MKLQDEIEKFAELNQRFVTSQEALDAIDLANHPVPDSVSDASLDRRNAALWPMIVATAPTPSEVLLKLMWLRRIDDDEREIGNPYSDDRTQNLIASIIRDVESMCVAR